MCNNSGTDVGQSIDYQQVFIATAFSAPTTINSLTWYYDNVDGGNPTLLGGTYTLYWGYAARGPLGYLSPNLPSNYISTRFDIGSFTIPAGGISDDPSFAFSFSAQQFTYDPSLGNLLLEIVVTNQDNVPNGNDNGANEADDTHTVTGRAFCVTNDSCTAGPEGLVTTFGTSTAVPEPATLAMLGSGVVGMAGLLRKKLIP
jgi:hypothetical protein